MKRKIITFLLAFLCLSGFSRAQIRVYFTPNGSGNQNGSSWANAMPGTQLAPIMQYYLSSVELWVAAGTYKPHISARDSSFSINSSLKVYGGFNGTETQLSQRNIAANPTILSGDIGVLNDSTDNSYHVVRFMNVDSSTVLDGFIIEEGNANSLPNWHNIGGGIRNWGIGGTSSPTISNCILRRNRAEYGGGGLGNWGTSGIADARLSHCTFEYNYCGGFDMGGGALMSAAHFGISNAKISVEDCVFQYNNSLNVGGAVALRGEMNNGGTAHFKRSTFYGNTAPLAAVIYLITSQDSYNPTVHTAVLKTYIDSCIIRKNTATIGGSATRAGIIFANYFYPMKAELHMTNSRVDSNWTNVAPVYLNIIGGNTKNVFDHCVFNDNTSTDVGGINIITGNASVDTTYLSNSLLYNSGKSGLFYSAAIGGSKCSSYLNNVTAYSDSTNISDFSYLGALVRNEVYNAGGNTYGSASSVMEINNSILWHERPSWMTNVKSVSSSKQGSSTSISTLVRNSIVNLNNGTWPVPLPSFQFDYGTNGGGNISSLPKFQNAAQSDFRLSCTSSAINAGSNTLIPAGSITDLDGNPRIYNSTVDMGCYEAGAFPLPVADPVVVQNDATINCSTVPNIPVDSLRWTFGDGSSSNQQNPAHTYTANGTYQVCLRLYAACGSDLVCRTVVVNSIDTSGPVDTGGTAINTVSVLNNMKVYPNPVTKGLYISGIILPVKVSLLNIMGSVIGVYSFSEGEGYIDLSAFASGLYLLNIEATNGDRKSVKILKE